jgi:hypothetical protein
MVNLIQKTNQIKGNELLLLNEPQKVWLVQSGSLAIFTTLFEGKEPKGSRRYLFTVNAGEALFGATPKQQRGILAVALEETELVALELDELVLGDGEAIALIQTWIHHLGKFLIARNLTAPDNLLKTDGEQYIRARLRKWNFCQSVNRLKKVPNENENLLWSGRGKRQSEIAFFLSL